MTLLCIAGHHNIFSDILFVIKLRHLAVSCLDYGLGMGHSGAHLYDNGSIVFFGNIKGQFGILQSFLGICGLYHGNL